jgi:hypothetical protein
MDVATREGWAREIAPHPHWTGMAWNTVARSIGGRGLAGHRGKPCAAEPEELEDAEEGEERGALVRREVDGVVPTVG